MADYDGGRVFLQVVPSFRNVQRLINSEASRWGRDAGKEFQKGFDREVGRSRTTVGPDKAESQRQGTNAGGSFADGFRRRVEAAMRSLPPVRIGVSAPGVDQKLRDLRLDLERLSGKTIGVDIDSGAAMVELERIDSQLADLAAEAPNIQVRADTAAARTQLSAIQAQVNDLDRDDVDIRVDVDGAAGLAMLNTFSGRLLFLGTAGAALAPAIVPAAGAAAVALAGIGAGALAGLGGIGALVIGFQGIGDAVKAMGDVQMNAAADAEASAQRQATAAASIASAQRQVANAERGLANARASAAEAAESAARRVADAQEAVGDAAQDAARDVASAVAQQEDAERALAAAQAQTRQAQLDLTQARRDARDELEDLELSTRSAALSEEDAELGLARARERLREARAEGATGIDLQEADLSVRQAQLRFDEARDRNQEAQEAAKEAQRVGVDGAEQVLAAQQRLADIRNGEVEAARRLRAAEEEVAQTRIDGAERVADAQERVVDAIRAQEQQQRQSAFAVAGAVASVEGAQASLAQAMQRTADTGSTSLDKLAVSMAALSPAGQRFAEFLYGLKPVWDDLKATVEENLFPGVQAGIEALLPVMPQITDMMGAFAGAMGDMFAATGEAFASPAWQRFFEYLATEGAPMLVILGEAVGNIAIAFAELIMAFAPMSERFVDGLLGITDAFAGWATALAESDGFQRFIRYVTDNAPVLMDFFSSLVSAVGQLLESMAPFGPVVLGIATAFLDLISALPPAVLSGIVLAVLGLVTAFTWLAPTILAVVGFVQGLIAAVVGGGGLTAVIAALGGPITLIVGGLIVLGAALVAAWHHSETFRDIVRGAFEAVQNAVVFAWEQVIQPALAAMWGFVRDVLAPTFMWLWREVIQPAWNGISTAIGIAWGMARIIFDTIVYVVREILGPVFTWLWHKVIEPVWDGIKDVITDTWKQHIEPVLRALGDFIEDTVAPAFQRGVDAIGRIWEEIRRLAATPVNFIIETVYNDGIRAVFNKVAAVVGSETRLEAIEPLRFASGGIMPGYTPGRDVHRFFSPTAGVLELSGGEGIARPEIVRAVGAQRWNAANAAARSGDPRRAVRYLGGYADGGVLSFAGGGIFGGIADLADMAREGIASAFASVGSFVLGGLRSAAQLALRPITEALSGLPGGLLSDLLRGLVERTIDSVLGFAGDEDAEGLLQGGGFARHSRGWPARRRGVVSPNAAAAAALVRDMFGLNNIGILGQRANRSDHPFGKALDVMIPGWNTPAGIAKGNQVASWFVENPGVFGTKYVIWRQQINSGSGWRGMADRGSPTANHMDHPHISLFDDGGWLMPGITRVLNATGRPERVLNSAQESAIEAALRGRTSGRTGPINQFGDVHLHDGVDVDLLGARLEFAAMSSGMGG